MTYTLTNCFPAKPIKDEIKQRFVVDRELTIVQRTGTFELVVTVPDVLADSFVTWMSDKGVIFTKES